MNKSIIQNALNYLSPFLLQIQCKKMVGLFWLKMIRQIIIVLFTFLFISCYPDDHQGLKERHNLFDYTINQAKIAKEYSIPLLDLYNESGITIENKDSLISSDNLHYSEKGYFFISELTKDFILKYGGHNDYSKKTIGVFGGSFSSIEASKSCKNVWVQELGITYTDYGKAQAGFSTLNKHTIDSQVDEANIHDIYLIWCSTNDCLINATIDSDNSESQSFGMKNTIDRILNKNPTGTILIFNSIKSFKYEYLYDSNFERY